MNFKFIIPIVLAILVGFLFGKLIFNNYTEKADLVFSNNEIAYFLQYGAYVSKEKMQEATLNLNKYIYDYDEEYYRVYIGITKDKNNLEKIKDFYKEVSKDIYVKEVSIKKDFSNYLENADQLLMVASDNNIIKTIIMETLKKYEESVSE